MSTSTSRSAPATTTYVSKALASEYMRRIIVTTLQRHGFDSAEEGALAEIDRLLSSHVQNTLVSASRHAAHARRSTAAAPDVLAAQSETSWPAQKLRRIAKKRRRGLDLRVEDEPVEPTPPETLDSLRDFMQDMSEPDGQGEGSKAEYAFEGAPRLPGKWTYSVPENPDAHSTSESTKPPSITPASLEFVKSIATEKDLDPELGIVHFRRSDKFGGGREGKRKWSTKGVGVA